MTPQEIQERRKNAAERLAVGSTLVGGAAVAQHEIKRRTGIKSPLALARDIHHGGAKSKHGKYATGWLATRAVTAAGLPLAVSGASNLMARRPKTDEGVDIRRDLISGQIDRSKPHITIPTSRRSAKEKAAAAVPIAGGAALGGLGGRKLASKISRNKGSKARIAAMGIGAGLGSAFGASAAVPVTRHAVDVASSGAYRYSPKKGIYHHEVRKAIATPTPVILPKKEQQAQQHRKHKAANLGMASAGIGVTALGLRAPAAVKWAAGRSKRIAAMKPVQRVASLEHKATPMSWNVGVLGTGVGSAAALNSARIQRAELRAEEGKVKKGDVLHLSGNRVRSEDVAKALVPRPMFRPRPIRFAGVKAGGIRRVQTATGLKMIPYRGSLG